MIGGRIDVERQVTDRPQHRAIAIGDGQVEIELAVDGVARHVAALLLPEAEGAAREIAGLPTDLDAGLHIPRRQREDTAVEQRIDLPRRRGRAREIARAQPDPIQRPIGIGGRITRIQPRLERRDVEPGIGRHPAFGTVIGPRH